MDYKEKAGVAWTGFLCFWIGANAGSCEQVNEPSGPIKCWEIVEMLSDWWFPKKDSDF
jgi:hypothetical protein